MLISGPVWGQATYTEYFEADSRFSLNGFVSAEDTPLPEAGQGHYLGYGGWLSETGGLEVQAGIGRNGSQGVSNSPNTDDKTLFSPLFEMEAGQSYSFGFWYAKKNSQEAILRLEIDLPDEETGNYQLLADIEINQVNNEYVLFESTFIAPSAGRARFRFSFLSSAGGQRIYLDEFFLENTTFFHFACNPNNPPLVRFRKPTQIPVSEDQEAPVTLTAYRLGFISYITEARIEYSGGSASLNLDFVRSIPFPVFLLFNGNQNEITLALVEMVPDALPEENETIIFQIISQVNAATDAQSQATLIILDTTEENLFSQNDFFTLREDTPLEVLSPGFLANDDVSDEEPLDIVISIPPQFGNLSLSEAGGFTYTPNPDFFGVDSFEYVLVQENQQSSPATVTLTVLSVNDAPFFENLPESLSLFQTETHMQVVFQLHPGPFNEIEQLLALTMALENENLLLDYTLTYSTENPLEAILTFMPNPDLSGEVFFNFSLQDDGGLDNDGQDLTTATLKVEILPVLAPVAAADFFQTFEDAVLDVLSEASVLNNDQLGTLGTGFALELLNAPIHGNLILNEDGTFRYQAEADFFGEDTFAYRFFDGFSFSPPATVSIDVLPVNDAPFFSNLPDTLRRYQNETLGEVFFEALPGPVNEFEQLLTLSVDTENESLLQNFALDFPYTGPNEVRLSFLTLPEITGRILFLLTLQDDGGQENGGQDQVTDSLWLEILPVLPPQAEADFYELREDTNLEVMAETGILANDVQGTFGTLFEIEILTPPMHGQLTLGSEGAFSYQPGEDFFGEDTFVYRFFDGQAQSGPATVSLKVLPVNDAPYFVNLPQSLSISQIADSQTLAIPFLAGPENELAQQTSLSVEVENGSVLADYSWTVNQNNPPELVLFYVPDPEKDGQVVFRLHLQDDGGLENGGQDQTLEVLNLEVIPFERPNAILLPNTFTPNEDTRNDRFVLRSRNLQAVEFIVFDRWGKTVYDTRDIAEATQRGWDGKDQPTGLYAWKVKAVFNDGEVQSAQGRVYLVK
ncbi:MAG: tandem-95 repeat protein [Microscillaceae bacterium]|nr:tandem-95 repeat protein [Microscillaceae bacterium]